jgi:hypothetical protein
MPSSNRVKLLVRIKRNVGEYSKIKKTENDGKTILMQKGKKNRPEWKFNFTRKSLYFSRKWSWFPVPFPKRMLTVDVFQYALEAIEYDFDGEVLDKQPIFDREAEDKIVKADVLKHYGKSPKEKTSGLTWIMLFLTIMTLVLLLWGFNRMGVI